MTTTKHIIMRRVFYSFALSIIESTVFWQGILLGACIAAFGRLTHVAAIWHNTLAVPIGDLPTYIVDTFSRAVLGGEFLTGLVTVLIVALSIKLARRLGRMWLHGLRTV